MHDIRTLIGKLNFIGDQKELGRTTRRMALATAKLLRGPAGTARATIERIAEVGALVEAETESWLEPEDIRAGRAGGFDACDLRHWLVIAELAGVGAVPAHQILELEEEELAAIDQKIDAPDPVMRRIAEGVRRVFPEAAETPAGGAPGDRIDREALGERLFAAMDAVPGAWMVRSSLCGPSTLKAFAGAGVIASGEDTMTLHANLEIGPGWVREGNRRRVDATDKRFVDLFAQGHKPRLQYLARPWITPARRIEGEDPHRHGTPFAGRGSWPCEWRVFVENGRVTGVASYYAWASAASPENARQALAAAELAERMVAAAGQRGVVPRFMDLEIPRIRSGGAPDSAAAGKLADASRAAPLPDHIHDLLARFPRESVSATLDFVEAADADGAGNPGLLFLEAGPAHTPIGGGHPCGFAGHEATEADGGVSACRGVALRLMDGVSLADPRTWRHGDTAERILSWEAARALAAGDSDAP